MEKLAVIWYDIRNKYIVQRARGISSLTESDRKGVSS